MTETIFTSITNLALENQAINLGQGFPDFDGPQWLKEEAIKAITSGKNQYAPGNGIESLREIIAENIHKYYELDYTKNEVTVTVGATEAIFVSLLALLNPGDEVIVFEPFYDSYVATIQMAHGKPVPVTLHSPHFEFNINELEQAVTKKTKVIMINSPHNPTGKVFNKDELQTIANFAKAHDLYVISDEVYEFLLFGEAKHIPIASFPGMKERTITISSTGKTFGLTGWKIGWAIATTELTQAIRKVKQFTTFCAPHPFQLAAAEGLRNLDSYLPNFQSQYENLKNLLVNGLNDLGFKVINPDGTYFCIVDLEGSTKKTDIEFCKELIVKYKVATIPPSAFYLKSDEGTRLLRFCFAKTEQTLQNALTNLSNVSF